MPQLIERPRLRYLGESDYQPKFLVLRSNGAYRIVESHSCDLRPAESAEDNTLCGVFYSREGAEQLIQKRLSYLFSSQNPSPG